MHIILALLLPLWFCNALAQPLVIAHRGASGVLPEHTLAAYELAIDQGADFVETDLVLSADGVLICRHDSYLGTTTNVADHEEYASRRRTLAERSDWYVDDFTLAEIRRLRALQPFANRDQLWNGKLEIPTLQQLIELVLRKQRETGRQIGIYPELKQAEYFGSQAMVAALLSTLQHFELDDPGSRVIIQSFDPAVLQLLKRETHLPLVLLIPASRDGKPQFPGTLDQVAKYADGLGAAKTLLLTDTGDDTGFVTAAKRAGLFVHAWTFRDDAVPGSYTSAEAELERYLATGIDGFFTDFPDTGVRARDRFITRHKTFN